MNMLYTPPSKQKKNTTMFSCLSVKGHFGWFAMPELQNGPRGGVATSVCHPADIIMPESSVA